MDSLLIFLKGLFMGIADIIPGVSGGTIALITGIYERLIKAISSIDFKFLVLFSKGKFKEGWKNILEIDFALLIPLALGIGVAILAMSRVMTYLLENLTGITFAFFFGLILGSASLLFKQFKAKGIVSYFFTLVGIILAYLLARTTSVNVAHSLPITFLVGIIAIIAMILPGISGSFILLLLGQYHYMLKAIKNFEINTIIVFMVGALIGLLGFSRLLNWILKKWEINTIYLLIGLMIGALTLPIMSVLASTFILWQVLLAGICGFFTIYFIHKLSIN